jgi:hypothetical protein
MQRKDLYEGIVVATDSISNWSFTLPPPLVPFLVTSSKAVNSDGKPHKEGKYALGYFVLPPDPTHLPLEEDTQVNGWTIDKEVHADPLCTPVPVYINKLYEPWTSVYQKLYTERMGEVKEHTEVQARNEQQKLAAQRLNTVVNFLDNAKHEEKIPGLWAVKVHRLPQVKSRGILGPSSGIVGLYVYGDYVEEYLEQVLHVPIESLVLKANE